jgi:multidrug efflux pump subunit AcrA (membrane-fusion protein)
VKVAFLERDKDLKPEMSANVTFMEKMKPTGADNKPQPVMYLPKEAVATRDGNPIVFEILNGSAQERPVTVGGERDGNVIIKKGLSGSELLVSKPPDSLKSGDRVRVKG